MRKILLTILLLGFCTAAFPQSSTTLYRGRHPLNFPYKFNGTYFWQSKEFTEGNLMYNGKLYDKVLMNIDAYSRNLIVIPGDNSFPVILDRDQVQWFNWKESLFVNLNYLGYTNAPEGFFQVIRDGDTPALRQIVKTFQNSTTSQNGETGGIGYYDPEYDQETIHYFKKVETLYVLKDGELKKINKRALRKLLSTAPGKSLFTKEFISRWHSTSEESGSLSAGVTRRGGIGLPDGFFSPAEKDTSSTSDTDEKIQATYLNKIYIIGQPSGEKTARLSGVVTDKETGEPLTGAVIFDEKTKTYARTDRKGRYSIDLPKGENTVHFSEETKEEMPLRVDLRGNGTLNVELSEKIMLLKEAVISASSMENHRRTAMGIESVSIKTMGKIPTAFGEGDIMRAVMTLPGVKSIGEASGGFNVRGGSADENLILFNENTIYNPSHLFGIFSAFNPDVIDHVDMFKASMPAEYGGRVSSVMKITSKEGDTQKIKGSFGLGVLTGRFHLEGPIVKDKTSFIVAVRTTYSDTLLKVLPKESAYAGGSANFMDVNAGITHRFNDRSSLQASFYYANDGFMLGDEALEDDYMSGYMGGNIAAPERSDTTAANRFDNLNASLIYRYREPDGNSFQIATGYDHYFNRTCSQAWPENAYSLTTTINQAFLKGWWKKDFGSHAVQAGMNVVSYFMNPGSIEPFTDASVIKPRTLDRETGLEPSLFASDVYTINTRASLDGGIRISSFYSFNGKKFYALPELRLAGKYSPEETLSFKGGIQSSSQFIHLISNTVGISPLDTWKLTNDRIRPTYGVQASAGVYYTYVNWGLDFSLESYYKRSFNALDYKPGAVLSMNPNLEDDLVPVYGRSYGIEMMVKRSVGSLTGWMSYTYSKALFKETGDRGYAGIAGGNWYNAPFDKPHEFKLVANWAITHRYSFSANVDYSTGRPITVPMGKYYFRGQQRIAYSQRNESRIPDYFRVDAAFNVDPGHYLKGLTHMSFTAGVYNVLGRHNPYSVYFRAQSGRTMQGYMVSVFATQVPYINVNIMF